VAEKNQKLTRKNIEGNSAKSDKGTEAPLDTTE